MGNYPEEDTAGNYPEDAYGAGNAVSPEGYYPDGEGQESQFPGAEQQEFQNTRIFAAGGYGSPEKNTQEDKVWQEGRGQTGRENQGNQESGDEADIHVKTMDMGQYNTLNLQAELAAGLREVLAEEKNGETQTDNTPAAEPVFDSETESLDSLQIEEADEEDFGPEAEEIESSEVFFGETGEIGDLRQVMEPPAAESHVLEEQVMTAQPPKELAGVLAQESDGQISLVLPESSHLEKQITGQMSIEDILTEWERMKKQNQQKREQEVRKHVLEHTGDMFTEFEASVRDGLLEKLEKDEEIEEDAISREDVVEELEEIQDGVDSDTDEGFYEEFEEDYEENFEEEPEEALGENYEEVPGEEGGENTFPREEEPGEDTVTQEEEQPEEEQLEETQSEEPLTDYEEDGAPQEENTCEENTHEEDTYEEDTRKEDTHGKESTSHGEKSTADEKGEANKKHPGKIKDKEVPLKVQTGVILTKEFLEDDEEEIERDKEKVRSLTREERELYAPYIQSRASREQLVKAIDNISMASYTGNLVITGEEGMDTLSLAKNVVREIQASDSNFSGKVAKISGHNLNKKDVAETLEQLKNGALIIEKSSEMEVSTIQKLYQTLQKENMGIVVILADTKKRMNRFLSDNENLRNVFTARIDVEALSNDSLVSFGKQYAKELEYSIDDLGILALHTRIESLQTSDHIVTVLEVKEIVDEAITHAKRKTLGHFFDILVAKRYDEEDMIILSEKDFV